MKLPVISVTNWHRLVYRIRHEYMTLNNIVIGIAFLVAVGWAWGSVTMMQRNYALQRKVDVKRRELTLNELEVQTLEYQKRYYQSAEYQELSARQHLGLAAPGEKLLILPPNSAEAKRADNVQNTAADDAQQRQPAPSYMQQWRDFLSGENVR